jgi:uncharacterized glyoxalase superfamily protein PhnB
MADRQKAGTIPFSSALALTVAATICTLVVLSQRSPDKTQTSVPAAPNARADNRIRLEHVALNVADPVLADGAGNMMLELYHNPPDAVPNYASMDPLLLHVAFMVDDVAALRQKLIAAGATSVDEITTTPAGDQLAMLRDPWGLAIQFVHRADPMLSPK